MLQVENVCSGYGKLRVLSGVSLSVASGTLVAILGPNGAGKTTLVETIMGLVVPSEGQISFDGVEITRQGPHRILRRGIALVPQGRRVFGPLSAERNLELGTLAAGRSFQSQEARRQLDLVYTLFPSLAQRRGQRAGTMSGGEQQMLAIGRALMSNPKLLLLDEPALGLAPRVVARIFEAVSELRRAGMTIILVEQNVTLALAQASRVYVLNVGRIVAEDASERLRDNRALSALYLGGRPES